MRDEKMANVIASGKYTLIGEKINQNSVKCSITFPIKRDEDIYNEIMTDMKYPIKDGPISIESFEAYLNELESINKNENLRTGNKNIVSDLINMLNNSVIGSKFILIVYMNRLYKNVYNDEVKKNLLKPVFNIEFSIEGIEPVRTETDDKKEIIELPKPIEKESIKITPDEKPTSQRTIFSIRCKKIDLDHLVCLIDCDGSERAKKIYALMLSPLSMISIDNPTSNIDMQQLEDMLTWLSESSESSSKNADIADIILEEFDFLGFNGELSFDIVISEYYRQENNIMRQFNLIELEFKKPEPLSEESISKLKEQRQLTQDELIMLQEQSQNLIEEINKLKIDKANLEEANSRLGKANSELASSSELAELINEFQIELNQIKRENSDLVKKTIDLNDEILELKKLLLKVKYDAK